MAINTTYNEDVIIKSISVALSEFYSRLVANINTLDIDKILKRKNPYLFRAKGIKSATQIVDAILSAFISSSEETVFGNVFFEPIACAASGGNKALAEGIDIMVERGDTIYAIAVKSGTSVFNADSRKKQEQNFIAASKLAQQVKKRFVPIIGYGYGRKKQTTRGIPKFYIELAGKEFWEELTGDPDFYLKLMNLMDNIPEQYADSFNDAYQRAENRLVQQFTNKFCNSDGSINWLRLARYNSGS